MSDLTAERSSTNEALKPLSVPQLFFGTLLHRDINPDSDEPRRLSGIIHKSSTPHEHPPRLLGAMRISKLRLEKSLILLAAGKNLPHSTAIVAVNQFQECLFGPGAGLGRKAKDLSQLGRPDQPVVLQVVGPGAHHRCFRRQP